MAGPEAKACPTPTCIPFGNPNLTGHTWCMLVGGTSASTSPVGGRRPISLRLSLSLSLSASASQPKPKPNAKPPLSKPKPKPNPDPNPKLEPEVLP